MDEDQCLDPESSARRRVAPVLRIFDVAKAEGSHLGFLGWRIDWAHRFVRPGRERQRQPWGRTVTVGDPFGNLFTFLELEPQPSS